MSEYVLMHYGVKGMKWGVRRKQLPVSETRKKVDDAKADYKAAKKDYNKSFNKAYNYSARHLVSQFVGKKAKTESNKRWQDAHDKADTYRNAKTKYKEAKAERKQKISDAYVKIERNTSLKERFVYDTQTRAKAAKYVVDNNMSMADANKKAKTEALRNTAAFIAAYGAITLATLYAKK